MSSRDNILRRLRATQPTLNDQCPVDEWRHMAPVDDRSRAALQQRFSDEAVARGCKITCCTDSAQVIARILELIGSNTVIQSWDYAHIPLPGLADALAQAEIEIAPDSTTARVGLTGADAALAGTGSLVIMSGPGKPRQPALLPLLHIAIITAEQIVPNLDTWIADQRNSDFERIRSASSSVVISGPSRTGDIANIPVTGVHGPGEVHVLILAQECP